MRVIVANAKSGTSRREAEYAAWQKRHGGVGFHCEAHNMPLALRAAGLKAINGPITEGKPQSFKGCRENVVALADHISVVSSRAVKLSPFVEKRFAADRWVTEVRTLMGPAGQQRRPVALFAFHANAVIRSKVTGGLKRSRGAQVWANEGLPRLQALMSEAIADGHDVILGGDGNWRANTGGAGSPLRIIEALGLEHRASEVMWLAWSPALTLVPDSFKVVPAPPGSDHIALQADLTVPLGGPALMPVSEETLAEMHRLAVVLQAQGRDDIADVLWAYRRPAREGLPLR